MARWWLGQETSTEIKSECLDILCNVLHRFGGLMTADHEKLLNALLVQLNLQRAGLRKRAIQCLGNGSFSYMPLLAIPCCELHNQEQNCHHFIPQSISNTANCRKMDANPLLACLKAIHVDTCFMIGTGKGEQSPDEQNVGCSITCGQHVRWSSCQGNYYCCANLEEQRSEARDDPDQHPNDRSFLVRVVSKCMTSFRHVLGYGYPSWLSVT